MNQTGMKRMRLSWETRRRLRVRNNGLLLIVIILTAVLLTLFVYSLVNNKDVKLEKETFTLPTLPADMEGYTILHVSDIHEYVFGDEAEKLGEALGTTPVKACVVTGGLTDSEDSGIGFLQLCAYFQTRNIPVYYILGDDDLPYMDYFEDDSYRIQPLYAIANALGAVYLDTPVRLFEGETNVWLSPASSLRLETGSAISSLDALEESYDNQENVRQSGHTKQALMQNIAYRRDVVTRFLAANEQHTHNDLTVMLTHIPLPIDTAVSETTTAIYEDADLILAGHYHRSLLRFLRENMDDIGAYTPSGKLLPDKENVQGLSKISGFDQYISPGLGTRRPWFLFKRITTKPTITAITLTKRIK